MASRPHPLDSYRDLVGQIPDPELARITGLGLATIHRYRKKHGIPTWQSTQRDKKLSKYKHLIGNRPDKEVADIAGVTPGVIADYRREHDIAAWSQSGWDGLEEYKSQLGKVPDTQIAKKAGVNRLKVSAYRQALGIEPYVKKPSKRVEKLMADYKKKLGEVPDREVAEAVGLPTQAVYLYRRYYKIPSSVTRSKPELPSKRKAKKAANLPPRFVWRILTKDGEGPDRFVVAEDLATAATKVTDAIGVEKMGELVGD